MAKVTNLNAGEQLSRLYDNYYRALVGYAMQIVADEDAAKDVVQTIFQRMWEKQIDTDNEVKVKAYLYNGVRNLAINSLRRKGTEARYADYVVQRHEEFHISDAGEEEFFTEEIYRLLFQKIDELPARQREVFLMCMEGKSYKEIGDALQISANTVKSQKHKAILRLKDELGELSFFLFLLITSFIFVVFTFI